MKILSTFALMCSGLLAYGQNNFPATGNVSIGTSSATHLLTMGEYGASINLRDRSTWATGVLKGAFIDFSDYNGPAARISLEHNYYFGASPRKMLFSISGNERMALNNVGYLGVGTTSPGYRLHVSDGQIRVDAPTNSAFMSVYDAGWGDSGRFEGTGNGDIHFKAFSPGFATNQLFLQNGGNVGIGTTSPNARLHVYNGQIIVDAPTNYPFMSINDASWGNAGSFESTSTGDIHLKAYSPSFATSQLFLKNGGNVGIGTTSPTEKLAVNGKIRSKEVIVEISGWPDYVFKSTYKNMSLQELEKFIKINGHLPEIPTAIVAESNGIELAEMNKLLLKKIEEITLHLIDQNKEIEALKKKLNLP